MRYAIYEWSLNLKERKYQLQADITKKINIKILTGAESVGGESGDGTKALQSIERNIANLEKSILNSSHRKTDEIYESDAHHQVNGFVDPKSRFSFLF